MKENTMNNTNTDGTVARPFFMGIDPGLKGAMAIYSPATGLLPYFLLVDDIPLKEKVKNRSSRIEKVIRNKVDLVKLHEYFCHYNEYFNVSLCILEEPHSMPTDGHVGAFSFGQALGQLQSMLACHEIPHVPVKPQVWKGLMGLKRDKNLSINLACETFPQHVSYFKNKKDDGRAEAAILAKLGCDRFEDAVKLKEIEKTF